MRQTISILEVRGYSPINRLVYSKKSLCFLQTVGYLFYGFLGFCATS